MGRKRIAQGWIEGTGWHATPVALSRDARLLPSDKLVLLYLCYVAGPEGAVWPARLTISAEAGVSPRTVDRVVSRLLQYGWLRYVGIRRVKNAGKGRPRHVYQLCIPRVYPTRAGLEYHATVAQNKGNFTPRRHGFSRHGEGGSKSLELQSEMTKSERSADASRTQDQEPGEGEIPPDAEAYLDQIAQTLGTRRKRHRADPET